MLYLCAMAKQDNAILVEMADGRKFLFGSVAAIYDHLTYEELGIRKEAVWASKLQVDVPLQLQKCTITKMRRISRKQENPTIPK